MKPIHKFNNGVGATLCHRCNVIIVEGFSNDLFCSTRCEEIYYKGKNMKKESYITETVFCLLNLSKDLLTPEKITSSPIWNEAYTEEEARERKGTFYKYTIKFNGTKPVQCTNVQRIDF